MYHFFCKGTEKYAYMQTKWSIIVNFGYIYLWYKEGCRVAALRCLLLFNVVEYC